MMTLAFTEHKSIRIWTSVWISRLYQHSAWLVGIYIFKWKNIAIFWKCVYLARAETSNIEICSIFKWRFFFCLFFYSMGVLISSLSHNILSLVSFIAQQANQNMAAKTTSFLYYINAQFSVSAWFGVDRFFCHIFTQKWPLFGL